MVHVSLNSSNGILFSSCVACPTDLAKAIGWSILAAVLMLLCVALFLAFNRKAPDGLLRPVVNFVQLMLVTLLLQVEWPTILTGMRDFFMSINLDLSFASPACLGIRFDFYGQVRRFTR